MFQMQSSYKLISIVLILLFINNIKGKNISYYEENCGTINELGTPLISGGQHLNISKVPWHVGIYERKYYDYQHICGGSIISERIVISAAHCFWDDGIRKVKNKNLYRIAAGKYYRNYYAKELDNVQSFEISEIYIPTAYESYVTQYTGDIALIHLNSSIVITANVKPICLNLDNDNIEVEPNTFGRVVGWGFYNDEAVPSGVLNAIDLPAVSAEQCKRDNALFSSSITKDKFCVNNVNGSTVCVGDSGGGFAVLKKVNDVETYFLRGIVSVALNIQNKCGGNYYTTFTNIQEYRIVIKYFLKGFNVLSNKLCNNTKLFDSITLNVNCQHDNVIIPCNEAISGSKALLSCALGYKKTNDFIDILTCNDEYEWDRTPSRCVAECGTLPISSNSTDYTQGVATINSNEFPWHARVYNYSAYFICDGTIISEKVIITAYYCALSEETGNVIPANFFQVFVAEYYDYYFRQFFFVTEIIVPQISSYEEAFAQGDIALFILDRPIQYKIHTKPICLESNEIIDYPPLNTFGKVDNWKELDDGNLLYVDELRTMSSSDCEKEVLSLREDYKAPTAVDKFCTSYLNNTRTMCSGEWGTPFAVPKIIDNIETYYLWGLIVGWIPETNDCSGDYTLVFTNVLKYHSFINSYLKQYKVK